jgi:AcrR family transcriptional regulator
VTKQLRSQQTRMTIVQAAAEMFDRYGYGITSLSDIVAHGGVTKGALYFHFTSKEQLARAVMEEQHRLIRATVDDEEQGRPALEALIRSSFRIARRLRNPIVRAGVRLTLESSAFEHPYPDPFRHWIAACATLLTRAEEELDVMPRLDAEATARFLVSSFTGIQFVTQVLEDRAELARRVEDMWRLVLPGLVPAKKADYHLRLVGALAEDAMRAGAEGSAPESLN